MKAASGRWVALQALLHMEGGGCSAEDALAMAWEETGQLGGAVAADELARERSLALELTLGVLRWELRLDALLDQLAHRGGVAGLHPTVRILMELGLYQLIYLDRIPEHAAVSETVALTRPAQVGFAAGFVNASLRRFLRERDKLERPRGRGVEAIAQACSYPAWFAGRMAGVLGADLAAFLSAGNDQPPITLRTHTERISREELLARLTAQGVKARLCEWAPHGITLEERVGSPARLPGFDEGHFTVQDEAAQIVGEMLSLAPGAMVLDACAAPGGKTMQLATQVGPTGRVIATDSQQRRLQRVAETAARLGLSDRIDLRIFPWGEDAEPGGPGRLAPGEARQVDGVLVDAPCSGWGVVRRLPEIKRLRTEEDQARYVLRQRKILHELAYRVAPGGQLVYAVCSPLPEEGWGVIEDFLGYHTNFELDDPRLSGPAAPWHALLSRSGALITWPHRHGADAFFAVRMRRRVEPERRRDSR